MALRDFYSGTFNFLDRNIRIEGSVVSGGMSLSGIDSPIRTDGGGFVVAEFSNGALVDRQTNLAWRALTTGMDGGATPVVVHFCDRRHQPSGKRFTVPHDDETPFDDLAPYVSDASNMATVEAADLRAVEITLVSITTEKPLLAGEWFSIQHPNWGWRAYNITYYDGETIGFRPPLREEIGPDTVIQLDEARCQMRIESVPGNPVSGRLGQAQIRFIEDMRKPTTNFAVPGGSQGGSGGPDPVPLDDDSAPYLITLFEDF